MSSKSLGIVLMVVCLCGCASSRGRYTDPYDRPVLPLRPGPAWSTDELPDPTAASTGAGAARSNPLPRSYVILLADDDDSVGQVDVEFGGERILLDRANQGVDLADVSRTFEVDPAGLEVLERLREAEPDPLFRFVVHFDLNAAEPSAAELERVRAILERVRRWPAPEVSISGHADRRGSESFNQALSQRRAAFVRRLLDREGIETLDPVVEAFGEGRPKLPTADGVAEPQNRRVEVSIR